MDPLPTLAAQRPNELQHPQPQHHNPLAQHHARTAASTPSASPGLTGPAGHRSAMSLASSHSQSEGTTPATKDSPHIRPTHPHKVRETHVANVDRDLFTGRKLINQYEVIEEIGRGMHGKVKLARNLDDGSHVAIKIIPRFSKTRRLGRITKDLPSQEKTKKEIAILKKIRHQNVVALLEVIDDPELKKIYMILEHVELGEIQWRRKGDSTICLLERLRVEKDMRGGKLTDEDENRLRLLERGFASRQERKVHSSDRYSSASGWRSTQQHQAEDEDERRSSIVDSHMFEPSERSYGPSLSPSVPGSRTSSRAPSRNPSWRSLGQALASSTIDNKLPLQEEEEDLETPGAVLRSNPNSSAALDGTMYGAYDDAPYHHDRSPSMADSVVSHLSSLDFHHDPFANDFSYVPCFTLDQARNTFRDTVLGLEYLHFENVVHRDIKPANLLWTKDHRVKISDFGVSYFGRPLREPGDVRDDQSTSDDLVSESEARDFDNDYELAKTVGTPAFFAPELCYTDDTDMEPPKVSEQIDVWSLGVTLYCLIFARIPFMAEDNWQMFRKIAKDEVYIPTMRLKPVYKKAEYQYNPNPAIYREADELAYEPVKEDLRDLLRQMLIKNPAKRVRLRDVKRHPWLQEGLTDFIAWMDDTDPSRKASGRKIQVNDEDLNEAVVPLTLFERAKSTIKKTYEKFRNPRSERSDSTSRKRATSSATSSAGDNPFHGSFTPHPHDGRRRSLRGGDSDYFGDSRSHTPVEHPLTYSVTASPDQSPIDKDFQAGHSIYSAAGSRPSSRPTSRLRLDQTVDNDDDDDDDDNDMGEAREPFERKTPSAPPYIGGTRHRHSNTVTNGVLAMNPGFYEAMTMPNTPLAGVNAEELDSLRKSRDMLSDSSSSRARSADRGLIFSSVDKRAGAVVSLSNTHVPGDIHLDKQPRRMQSRDLRRAIGEHVGSPVRRPTSPRTPQYSHHYGQHRSDPNLLDERFRTVVQLEQRPSTAHRTPDTPDAQTPPPRKYNSSTAESFARAQETMRRRQRADFQDYEGQQSLSRIDTAITPESVPCPTSPDDEDAAVERRMGDYINADRSEAPTRTGTASTTFSQSTGDMTGTPLTIPSLITSPLCVARSTSASAFGNTATQYRSSEHMLVYHSDPSLPALLSGSSSVSADLDAEFLANPGNATTANNDSLLETTDSLTPPASEKQPQAGFPIEVVQDSDLAEGVVPVMMDDRTVRYIPKSPALSPEARAAEAADDASGEDSDSDEGLVMGRSSRRNTTRSRMSTISTSRTSAVGGEAGVISSGDESGLPHVALPRRRDTNISVASTDTAKKVGVSGNE